MNTEDRVNAVAEFGFTARQARFLILVMRHSGVCLLRQYSTFAGIVHGQKTRAFFRKLVSRRYASEYPCRHNRGRLYHVHHHGLYRAIGEPNSAHRRPLGAGRIFERLMLLDAVLAQPELHWLATAAEKAAHFTASTPPVAVDKLPRVTQRSGSSAVGDPFPDKQPIGIDATGRAVLLYLVLPSAGDDFRAFLGRHADLLRALPSWTLRLVFPRHLADSYGAFQAVVHEEWDSPLHARTVDELRWYFGQLRTMPSGRPELGDERVASAARAFERPRFYRLYRRWLRDGDTALNDVSSAVISEALAAGAGRVDCYVLPHAYDHLAPLVVSGGSTPREAEKGAEDAYMRGEQTPAPPRPPSMQPTDAVVNAASDQPTRSIDALDAV